MRWPTGVDAGSRGRGDQRCGVRIGERRGLDAVDRWLVNRWGAHSLVAGRLVYTPVVHQRWRLCEVEVIRAQDGLSAAAGLLPGPTRSAHTSSAGWPESCANVGRCWDLTGNPRPRCTTPTPERTGGLALRAAVHRRRSVDGIRRVAARRS
ncbi:DUF2071 domain-containing protein [Euzebya sp.]|uniref:DUF2071 domain-containing protein n=1 Tax=Euzebya sp. TaxID=1971409 RepID=UPI003518C8AE